MTASSRTSRRFIHSEPGETLEQVARRAIGATGDLSKDQYEEFLSWNIHLSNGIFSHVAQNTTALLPSEVVYIEAPLPPATS